MSSIKIKQINNSQASIGASITFDGVQNKWVPTYNNSEFSSVDLTVDGNLVVQHTLGRKFVTVKIYDEFDEEIVPDSITMNSITQTTIGLSSFEDIITDWTVLVS